MTDLVNIISEHFYFPTAKKMNVGKCCCKLNASVYKLRIYNGIRLDKEERF